VIAARATYGVWRRVAAPSARAFGRALDAPECAQTNVWREITGLAAVHLDSWRSRTPLTTYEDVRPALDRLAAGAAPEPGFQNVTRLVPSSGSSGPAKWVPSNRALERAMRRALDPWIVDLTARIPDVAAGPAYWSVSPAASPPPHRARLAVGFEDDAAYLGGFLEPLVRRVLVAPPGLRRAISVDGFQYATLLLLLAEADLRLISVWHPSFFDVLLDLRASHWPRLLHDLERGTFRPPADLGAAATEAVESRLRRLPRRAAVLRELGPDAATALVWPRLACLSAWGDAAAAGPLRHLAARVAPSAVEAKGILATEAFVSLPFGGRHPLAIRSHFFEFLAADGRCLLAHEVLRGERYEIVVTNQAGLARYRLGDVVEVDGWVGATPSVRLVGRADRVVDLTGEKLSEAFVASALARALPPEPADAFALLAPQRAEAEASGAPRGYVLFVGPSIADATGLAARLDRALRDNPHYSWSRDLGQLAPPRAVTIGLCDAAAHAAVLRAEARGRTFGAVKPSVLSARDDWHFPPQQ
jgi:hypothetical protein